MPLDAISTMVRFELVVSSTMLPRPTTQHFPLCVKTMISWRWLLVCSCCASSHWGDVVLDQKGCDTDLTWRTDGRREPGGRAYHPRRNYPKFCSIIDSFLFEIPTCGRVRSRSYPGRPAAPPPFRILVHHSLRSLIASRTVSTRSSLWTCARRGSPSPVRGGGWGLQIYPQGRICGRKWSIPRAN